MPSESGVTGGGDAVFSGCCNIGVSQMSQPTPMRNCTKWCLFLMQNLTLKGCISAFRNHIFPLRLPKTWGGVKAEFNCE